ncbi:Aste57867_16546 [Aphanomyces stellatus]|uniref:Aste57867_16546 protein n=1 Tax=Aphanomyces stellatus TaxID=120398 RepID=A0A485L626_9STRA|nr:hypothetical protein As57867_016489 [Aphanomyces stellatus]VFT93320.1 Aste57867_16546 [Aphanomyces stellatus]
MVVPLRHASSSTRLTIRPGPCTEFEPLHSVPLLSPSTSLSSSSPARHKCHVSPVLGGLVILALVTLLVVTTFSPSSHADSTSPPTLVVIGDSFTQFGADPATHGFVAALANDYVRRADVLNRGVEGWTTRSWRAKWPQLLVAWQTRTPILVAIFLGADDAAIGVPLDEYTTNIMALVTDTRAAIPDTPILILTPPPVDATKADLGAYAAACVSMAAAAANVSVLDLWTALQLDSPDMHLNDRLHLNAKGNALVHALLIQHIETSLPALAPAALPYVFV